MKTHEIEGLKVDAEKIGQGLYAMICERGEESIVAFGMIPLWVIEILEKELKGKLIELANVQGAELDEKALKGMMEGIVRNVSIEIYKAASVAGKMVA